MDARRPVNVATVDHQVIVIEFQNALQVELVGI